MKLPEIIIYTDGSSRGNPGAGGWGAIVAWSDKLKVESGKWKVKELGGGEKHTTNNRMELLAGISALSFVRDLGDEYSVEVRADSSYVINGITKWVFGWQKNGWRNSAKEEVLNRDLWEKLAEVVSDIKMSGSKISWVYAKGHSGIPGNERADVIATAFADEKKIELFDGERADYSVDLDSMSVSTESVKPKKSAEEKARQKMKAYSYLSLVGGKFMRHTSWAECEKRVKGVKGVKFKKAVSAEEEREIMRSWGI